MKLAQLQQLYDEYRLALRHNPKQFYPQSFRVEVEGPRLIVVATMKRHYNKRFRIVGVLKRRSA